MLKKIRTVLAVIFWFCITMLFLDFTGSVHAYLGWMAKIQFLPACLALNFVVVAVLLVLTVLFGRVYCSVICPLGIYQDIVSWINGKTKKKKRFRFGFSKEHKLLRYGLLAVFIIAFILGAGSFVALLEPYSAYGRMVNNLAAPVYQWINNAFALVAEHYDSYAFYEKEVWLRSLPTFIIAIVTLIVVSVLAWKGGRTYCNNICPVGTILGTLSRWSVFAPVIDDSKCVGCHLCGKACKSSCIDTVNHKIDYSRCVVCFDCINNCNHGAIRYAFRYGKKEAVKSHNSEESNSVDTGKRAFMTGTAVVAGTALLKAQDFGGDGGLAPIVDKKIIDRETRITPPGSVSLSNMAKHCTGCQLCVSACPNNVLRPSASLLTLMQPEMSFERGYCRPECTKCSEVCPAGAILQITKEEKTAIHVGHAVIDQWACVTSSGEKCGNCARHCPVGAIRMVANEFDPEGPRTPVVNEERCIGCGACEYVCPVRPVSAIYVEGNEVHRDERR